MPEAACGVRGSAEGLLAPSQHFYFEGAVFTVVLKQHVLKCEHAVARPRAVAPSAGIPGQRLELEQHAGDGAVGPGPHHGRHLRHEAALAVRGHVLLLLLLAHRGPLELLHQLPALVSGPGPSLSGVSALG